MAAMVRRMTRGVVVAGETGESVLDVVTLDRLTMTYIISCTDMYSKYM